MEPQDCKYFQDCSQAICPFDCLVESRVGYRGEKCLNFAKVFGLLSDEQKKMYQDRVEKLKIDKDA